MFQIAIVAVILTAIPYPPQDQGSAQIDARVQTTAPPQDSITVPDATPLTLELEHDVSSATAKVGDTVEFDAAYSVRIDEMVIVPKGIVVSGTVVQVKHSRRLSRDGEVKVAAKKLILPTGELVTLRPRQSRSKKPQRMAPDVGADGRKLGWWVKTAALNYLLPYDPANAVGIPVALGAKGKEQAYPSGTRLTVYFNGPLELNRGAVMKVQPPRYEGPAQVFFRNRLLDSRKFNTGRRDKLDVLFCGQKLIGDFVGSLRLELNPGTYSFRTGKAKEKTAQLEVQQNHRYWIERDRGGLFVRDSEQHQDEIEALSRGGVSDNDLTSSSPDNSCVQAPLPRVSNDDFDGRIDNL